jgi:dihydroorotase
MKYLIKNAKIVNEGSITEGDVLINDQIIEQIGSNLSDDKATVIDAKGKYLLPGVIDDQVHFREPGLTHKANIYTESRAAVAGGVTSFMEMPNVKPATLTIDLLEEKYKMGEENSLANYSFYLGASNENLDVVKSVNPKNVCGVKVFMGSSTGNMLVDDREVLEGIFQSSPILVATHCEDEATIRANSAKAKEQYGEDVPIAQHPVIRNEEACYKSSSLAVELAKKYNTRLHILHISTEKEIELFDNNKPLEDKRITAEVCVHHLWFNEADYDKKGTYIKWNPAVKSKTDQDALFEALLDDHFDVIATDHAPHTIEEKENKYFDAPSGGPLVQHPLYVMLEFWKKGRISIERVVEKMSHAVAVCFEIEKRGYIKEGYFADLVLVDPNQRHEVTKDKLLYKCGWSPFEGTTFSNLITHTFISGHLSYENGKIIEGKNGMRLTFER